LNLRPLRPEPRARLSPTGVEHAREALGHSTHRRRVVLLLYFAAVLLAKRTWWSGSASRSRGWSEPQLVGDQPDRLRFSVGLVSAGL